MLLYSADLNDLNRLILQILNRKVDALGVFPFLAAVEASKICRNDLMPNCLMADVCVIAPHFLVAKHNITIWKILT